MKKIYKATICAVLLVTISIIPHSKAQDISVKKGHPRLILSNTDIKQMRENVLSGTEPWKTSWGNLKHQLDSYVDKGTPKVYRGNISMAFYQAAIKEGSMARDLSIAYQITKDKAYANKAIEIIKSWSSEEGGLAGLSFDSTKYYPNTGMLVSRGVFTFLYAYDLLAADKLIDKKTEKQFKNWLRILVPHIKEGARRWEINDYFGKQYYQNHIAADAVGLLSLGVILRDNQLVKYAYDGQDNPRNIKNVIEGLILMKDQKPYSGEPGSWPVQDGEIMDRYRHFALHHYQETTKPNRALQYAGLSTNLLVIAAEIAQLNGLDLYGWKAATGEEIKQPLLFYADFYIQKDASIKGGFYDGETYWINTNNQATFSLWEVAHSRYPSEAKFKEVLKNNDRSSGDLHLLGPVLLTHGRSIDNE
ncbi:alginate lyase family protein [Pseudopedobacter beijingensis]|uniref:Alginate lyase family protein n=1 Tax=Pseudopedobacter beijingensis TaxID=1207056 RepID=A0ABW4I8L5_9SPHI